jgi:RNA-directed DNA polymerase
MRNILELSGIEAREFLLKEESYLSLDLPSYFSFQQIIDKLNEQLNGKKLSDFITGNPREFDDVNYQLLTNKDGKYAWRPFKLINPAIYVSLIHSITEDNNWQVIRSRFEYFSQDKKIECHSLPIVSEEENEPSKNYQILNWWQKIEQESISMSLDYKYELQTDITDCYGSIYTHSISWALHSKAKAKKKENRNNKSLIGVSIDNHLQDMSFGQTNGIPQGSVAMDFIAEIVLGYIDTLLSKKLTEIGVENYKILRYRDDYRIFTNNPFEAEQITKTLSEILPDFGMRLNPDKTKASDNIIKNSIKPDKRYWITNKRKTESKQKWLIQIFLLAEQFPNSGTLDTQMKEFLKFLKKSKKSDPNIVTLISLVTDIAFRNPRVSSTSIAILSLLIKQIENINDKKAIIQRIKIKFSLIANSAFLKVWLQRLYLKIDDSIEYDEILCKKVVDEKQILWNTDWLNPSLKKIINTTPIVKREKLKKIKDVISKKEIKTILRREQQHSL